VAAPTQEQAMPLPPSHRHQAFIESRLFPWLYQASADERERFFELTTASSLSARKAKAVLARLQTPEAFARPLLVASLQARFNLTIDVDNTELVRAVREEGLLESRLRVSQVRLLEAAMQNFEAQEPQGEWAVILPCDELTFEFHELASGRISRRWKYDKSKALGIAPRDFEDACRQLDLGQRYLDHLNSLLDAAGVAAQLRGNFLNGLATQAQVAFMRQQISEPARDCLLDYVAGDALEWAGEAVTAHSVTLLVSAARSGYELAGPVVFQRPGGAGECIAYLPGDPDHPLEQYPSLQHLADSLRERLRDAAFRARFMGYVAQDEQPAFNHRLVNTLSPQPVSLLFPKDGVADPSADIGVRLAELGGDMGWACHRLWRRRLLHNALKTLVPTAEVDREARDKRLMGYLADGLSVLNVAAFFVPALGVFMLGVGVVQVFADVFVGIDDWRHGQTEEALEHLASVVENLAVVAAAAGTGIALKRSPFIEGMEVVPGGPGEQRLWHADLAQYRSNSVRPAGAAVDELGLYAHEGKTYVRIGDHLYQVTQGENQAWAIAHPVDPKAYRPGVLHNGEGAWQVRHERPEEWQGATLMQRWGHLVDGLSDEHLLRVQRISGLSDAELRMAHVQRAPMPALLKDSLARFRLALRLGGEPFQQAFAQLQVDVGNEPALLRRDFPGLASVVAQEIISQATDAERASLLLHGRVPLRIAEHARLALRRLRVNRAIEGLYFPGLRNPDAQLLAARFLPELPATAANSVSRGAALATLVAENRTRAELTLGLRQVQPWFRSPLPRASGTGYELSGRGLASWLPDVRLRRLYPLAGDVELAAMRESIQRRVPLERGIDALEQQYFNVVAHVEQWVRQPGSYVDAAGVVVDVPQASRQQAGARILAAWRRETPMRQGRSAAGYGFRLDLAHLHLGDLPNLGAGFEHIEQLLLDDTQLSSDPSAFLRHFPRLRYLGLADNQLATVPPQIGHMSQLRGLDMRANRLVGSADSFSALASGPALQELLLEGNALQSLPRGWPAADAFPYLQRLDISDNGLQLNDADWRRIAHLPALRTLDLSFNEISLSPASGAALARMTRLRQLHLHYNPLGLPPDVGAMGQLRVLALSRTQIDHVPPGLWRLLELPRPNLLVVDLAQNMISDIAPLPYGVVGPSTHEFPGPFTVFFSVDSNPLTEASVENLQLADPRIQVNVSPVQGAAALSPNDWRAGLPAALRTAIAQESETAGGELFFSVLARCTETADYRVDPAGTLTRMRNIAEAVLQGDSEGTLDLRTQLFEEAEDITGTCGDGVSLVLNRFESVIAVWRAASSALAGGAAMLPPLVRESERLLRLALVDDQVMAIARARVRRRAAIRAGEPAAGLPALEPLDDIADHDLVLPVDEVELRLLVLRSLANPASPYAMDLPAQPQNVLYGEVVSITTLAGIRDDVLRGATRPALLEWLSQQRYWATYLEKLHAQAFDPLREQWAAVADYFETVAMSAGPGEPAPVAPSAAVYATLEQALPDITWRLGEVPQWPQLSEQQYLSGYDRLMALRFDAIAALVRQLTVPLVQAHSALPSN
jgi:hypothetical protein